MIIIRAFQAITSAMLRRPVLAVAATLVWCMLIFAASAQPNLRISSDTTLDFVLRKTAHAVVYAVLCMLASMTAAQEGQLTRRAVTIGFVATVAYAVTDELHQLTVVGRHASWIDVSIDAIGALIGSIALLRAGMLRS